MKKINNFGFFLIETMVVIAIVGIVITFLFASFSNIYNRFSLSESYNTIAALNAASSIRQYIENEDLEYAVVLGGRDYLEITDVIPFSSEYYTALRDRLKVTKVYLIDTDSFFADENNLNDFGVNTRSYLDTLREEKFKYILVIENENAEYGYVPVFNYYLTLKGDSEEEYVNYVAQNQSFIEPGYEAKDRNGNNLNVYVTGFVDTSVLGTYYLNYNVEDLTVRRKVVVYSNTYTFDYTGDYQVFTAPISGTYKVELWGAQGGNASSFVGGKGGYTKGNIYLNEGDKLYIYIGGNPTVSSAYNGGGNGGAYGNKGGGATDIRLNPSVWNNLSGLRSRIMVAAGGGGAGNRGEGYGDGNGGYAGGLVGGRGEIVNSTVAYGSYAGEGGTQTAGGQIYAYNNIAGNTPGPIHFGSFGAGGGEGYVGGGGGYYGGGGMSHAGGGGGSSFISGYTGCNAVIPDGTHTNQPTHYSGYRFSDMEMVAGNSSMPSTSGGTETGHAGNGYAKITATSPNPLNSLSNVRYVYSQVNGSSANRSGHWVEMQVYDINGNNISQGLTTISSSYLNGDSSWLKLTDGDINTANYIEGGLSLSWVVIDLGAEYDLSSIRLWHYYGDGRTYYENEVRVAGDDQVYRTVLDTDYSENSYGRIIRATNIE